MKYSLHVLKANINRVLLSSWNSKWGDSSSVSVSQSVQTTAAAGADMFEIKWVPYKMGLGACVE
jgi:hypothetical protein